MSQMSIILTYAVGGRDLETLINNKLEECGLQGDKKLAVNGNVSS